jgi:lipopolysaccharide biosynthesis glycosyltransferase
MASQTLGYQGPTPTKASLMSTAIGFICNYAYLVPSVGAALQARHHTSDPDVKIEIFVTDASDELLANAQSAVQEKGIRIRSANLDEFASIESKRPSGSQPLPLATFARLGLDELFEPDIDRFLYLDGDIEITASLDPLLAQPIPSGGFLAAPDVLCMIATERSTRATLTRSYIRNLGIQDDAYFNAGVLLVDRRGWKAMSAKALDYYHANSHLCIANDQSALNAVAGAARGRLSILWNYQSEFMHVLDPRRLGYQPAIWHFTGSAKPWQSSELVWGKEFGKGFAAGAEIMKSAGIVVPPPREDLVAGGIDNSKRGRFRLTWMYPWRRITRGNAIRAAISP